MSSSFESDAASVNEALQEPAPRIDSPTTLKVDLLRGYQSQGEWLMSAVVRELNGEDEEILSAYDIQKNVTYSEYMTQLLRRGVVSVGDLEVAKQPAILEELIVGDRDVLFLSVIKATYGRYRDFQVTCRECSGDNDITMDLEKDFTIEQPKVDLHAPIEVTLKNGENVQLRYPTGGDSQIVGKRGKTTAEQNTLMLSRCVMSNKTTSEKEAWARGLSLADRNKLVKSLFSAQPGPRMEEVETQCAHCSAKIVLALDWVALLFG